MEDWTEEYFDVWKPMFDYNVIMQARKEMPLSFAKTLAQIRGLRVTMDCPESELI